VVVITYNQQDFIRQTLESVLEQRTTFPIEVIVADDGSTDETPAIIRELTETHPEVMRPILRQANVGIHANLTDALGQARGTYIALCEGDDYWTDPEKLSRQVSVMEERPGVAVCFHPVQVVWTDDSRPDEVFPTDEQIRSLTLDGLLADNFIQTNSVVYRRLPRYDDVPDVMPLDWYLHLRHAMTGEITMLSETMAVYRRHPGGIWYDSTSDHARFWSAQGDGHAALCEALLDLFGSDPGRHELISSTAARVLGELARIETRAPSESALLHAMVRYPRWAEVAARSQHSRLAQMTDELAAAKDELAGANALLAQSRQHASDLHDLSLRQTAQIEQQRQRIVKQHRRIERLKKRLEKTTAELTATRARLPRERLRRQARRLIGRSTATDQPPQ
jgi:hypothetical protein